MQFEEELEVAAPPERALKYLANFNNLVDWEPTVTHVSQTHGNGAGEGSVFDVDLRFAGQQLAARYVCTDLLPSQVRFRVEGEDFTGFDQIHVVPRLDGTSITYFAEINPQGLVGKLCTPISFVLMEWNNVKLLRNIRRCLEAEAR